MPASERTPSERRLYWWKEAAIIAVFYGVYSLARNQFGSARVDVGEEPVQSFNNAMRIIQLERRLHLFKEPQVQNWFLPYRGFIQFWNTYYGTAHFVVTIGAFIWLFRRKPIDFPRWRNTLGVATMLAIVGFSLFPLMPPRLLNSTTRYGGERVAIEQHREDFGFVDTLETYGGPWSFDSGAMKQVSNQYASMPSLHIGWSSWCAFVMWKLTKRKWARALLVLYPGATLFCIIVTANHYWIDGVGGLLCLALGYLVGARFDRWNDHRNHRRTLTALEPTAARG